MLNVCVCVMCVYAVSKHLLSTHSAWLPPLFSLRPLSNDDDVAQNWTSSQPTLFLSLSLCLFVCLFIPLLPVTRAAHSLSLFHTPRLDTHTHIPE
jgi:hypothetical protein